MAYPGISFTVIGDEERVLLRLAAAGDTEAALARRTRLAALLGRDFAENSVEIDAERGGFRLTGLIGLPTLNRAAPRDQYLVVNGRPVRDKLLVGAVRGAYQDVLARDRHPMVALFLDGPAEEIDVNVHPGEGRGAVPRRRVGARSDRRRAAQRARRRRASRLVDGRRRGGRGLPPRVRHPGVECAALRLPVAAADPVIGARRERQQFSAADRGSCRAQRHRSAPRARSCTEPTSSRRPRPGSFSSTSMRRMSGWFTNA